jgi:imidazolonepropionase-like amidohydrolase
MAQEFPRMGEFGMTPMEIIKSTTSRPADMLDMACQLGVVAPGAYADIVAVNGDPLRDVNVLGAVKFVMKDGGVFKNEVK